MRNEKSRAVMTYLGKRGEAEARARLRAFWSRQDADRPALWVAFKPPHFQAKEWTGPEDLKTREMMPAFQRMMLENVIQGHECLAEAMPGYKMQWGSSLVTLAVLAGGDYAYEGNTAYIQPEPDLYARRLPRFDAAHPVAKQVEAIYRTLATAAKGRAHLSPPAMLDAMTTLSRFRGTEQLCLDLLERPGDVKRWSGALTVMYNRIYEHFYQLLVSLGFGETSTWLSVMAEGRFEAVQCDFAVTVSPELFREFVLPDLRVVTDDLDFSLYHLDGVEQMRFLDLLRECPKLNGIQWNPQPGVGSPTGFVDSFRRIQEHDFSLWIGCPSVDEAVELARALGPKGLFLTLPVFDSQRNAEEAVSRIAQACRHGRKRS